MKKILLCAALMCGSMFAMADEALTPNRLLVVNSAGSFKSYMTERVEAIEFRNVEGPVLAKVKVSNPKLTELTVDVNMTPDCAYYMIDCISGVLAHQFESNPLGLFSYITANNTTTYNEDFNGGRMSGLDLQPNTEYAVVTVAYDALGTECDASFGYFTTPSLPLQGDPKVNFKLDGATHYTISGTFTANSDVDGYSFLIGEKGELEKSFQMWAGAFGFANIGDMVKGWGMSVAHDETEEHTFKDLEPNKDYEIYVQAMDKKGVNAPVQIFNARTATMGGDGAAVVGIKIASYTLTDWDGQMLPTLAVSFTPNDQAGAYRFFCALEADYDEDPQEYKEYICSDPEMPTAHWFNYGEIINEYQVNPGQKIVIIAAAKNAKGEWGEVTELRYTAPASASMAGMPASGRIQERSKTSYSSFRPGQIPSNLGKRIRLTK